MMNQVRGKAVTVGGQMDRLTGQMDNRTMRMIDLLVNVLLVVILFVPMALSASALSGLAADNGVAYPLLFPVMVDGSLLIFKLLALRYSLRGQRNLYAWTMAIIATGISVVLNVMHAEPTALARFMAALPPLAILAAFVAVVRHVEDGVRWDGAVVTASALSAEILRLQEEEGALLGRVDDLQQQVATLKDERKQVKAEKRQGVSAEKKATANRKNQKQERARALWDEGMGQADIAAELGVSARTVRRYLNGAVKQAA